MIPLHVLQIVIAEHAALGTQTKLQEPKRGAAEAFCPTPV